MARRRSFYLGAASNRLMAGCASIDSIFASGHCVGIFSILALGHCVGIGSAFAPCHCGSERELRGGSFNASRGFEAVNAACKESLTSGCRFHIGRTPGACGVRAGHGTNVCVESRPHAMFPEGVGCVVSGGVLAAIDWDTAMSGAQRKRSRAVDRIASPRRSEPPTPRSIASFENGRRAFR